MGLSHSRRQNSTGGTFPWALGHGVDGRFVTMMAYGSAYGAPRVSLFSSPNLTCNGLPCGVDRGDPVNGADAVHTLRHARTQVAAYREAVAPPPAPTTASIDLLGPTLDKLTPDTVVPVTWQTSSNVASVDVYFRVERKRAGSRWKKRDWKLLSAGETDGSYDWTVPHKGKPGIRTGLRLRLRAYDSAGSRIAGVASKRFRVPRRWP